MIRGRRAALRPMLDSDLPFIHSWNRDRELRRLVEGDYPGGSDSLSDIVREASGGRRRRYFIIVADARPIGDVELDHITWRRGEAELRIRIGERAYWNKGYGTDAVLSMLRYAFFDLGLRTVYLRVFADNARAVSCYRKCGFTPEGVLEREGDDGLRRRVVLMTVGKDQFLAAEGRLLSA